MNKRNFHYCRLDDSVYCANCNEDIDEIILQGLTTHHCTFPVPMGQMQLFTERVDHTYLSRMPFRLVATFKDSKSFEW